ncbi:hypothetical protein HED54_09750 [Ochrobactrum anthropi ATCC 49188]|nr:hypothetical protein [Brucella anthropi ATCC 49188]
MSKAVVLQTDTWTSYMAAAVAGLIRPPERLCRSLAVRSAISRVGGGGGAKATGGAQGADGLIVIEF